MTDDIKMNESTSLIGKLFLYVKPELLNEETHASMGFTPAEKPFDFVKDVRAVPLTLTEMGSAQRNYPLIFSNLDNPVPVAVVGLLEDANLFVDDDGQWDPACYVPTYLRCYPFAFAKEIGGKMAVVVDREAASVSETPEYPFFADGRISEHTEALMLLCSQYEGERKRTQAFCQKLVELDLLTTLRAAHTPEGSTEPQSLADYVAIDAKKLDDLPADVIFELHQAGYLSACYLHLYSLENWRHLMARRVARSTAI